MPGNEIAAILVAGTALAMDGGWQSGQSRPPAEPRACLRSEPYRSVRVVSPVASDPIAVPLSSRSRKHLRAGDRPSAEARLFHALTEHATDAIGVLDAQGGIRHANAAFCRMFGARPEHLVGTSALGHMHPDDAPVVAARLAEIVRTPGASASAEYRVRHADGTWHSRRGIGHNHLDDPAIAGIVVSSCDATERDETQRALRASEERYRRLVETSHDGICTVGDDGTITYANRRLAEMLGYGLAELTGQKIFDFMTPEAAVGARTRFEYLQRGVSEARELSFRRKDGTTIWVRKSASPTYAADGSFVGATFVLGDITERRLAEAAHRESDARYRLLFERSPLPMYVVDVESRRFLAANDAAVANYGYSPEEFLAMRLDDLRPAEDRAAFVAWLATIGTNRRVGVVRHQRKDGTLVDADIVWDQASFGDRPAWLVMAEDVTQRLRAEAAARDAHDAMATLVNASPLAIVTVDERGMVTTWNAAAERIFGWSAAEVVGHEYPLLAPAELAGFHAWLRDQFAGCRVTIGEETQRLRRDGTLVPVSLSTATMRNPDGRATGVVTFLADLTTRRETEAALDEARRHMELLLASTGEGIYAVDAAGLTTFVNPAAARLLGSTPERLLGQELHALIHHSRVDGTAYDADDCPVNASIREGAVHRVDTEVFWREDGTSFPVEYVSTPIRKGGRIAGAVVAFQDITERRHLEQQLRQGQKMEAIGRLAGGVAHDFNNLLTVITGYAVMLLTELAPEDPMLPDLHEIQAASARGAGLTRQLLAFSRQQFLQPSVIDLRRVVGGMEGMLRRLIGEDIEFTVASDEQPLYLRADTGQIEQVVMNLVVNARDAMPAGGDLSIEIENAPLTEDDRVRFPFVTPGEYVRLSVRDTGCGMDERTQSQIFDPFFTTKAPGQGTGLGLATVYGIVKQSGGYVWAESALGHGTTFRVYLPRVDGEPVAQTEAPAVALSARPGTTVLVVEDEDALRAVIERILRKRGYTVLSASSGADALAIVECQAAGIDLLVTDVVMPHMSGQELANRLVQQQSDLPVLFMSGYSLEAVANHGVLRPGAQLLKKPFTPQEMAHTVSEVVRVHAEPTCTDGVSVPHDEVE